MSSLPDHDRRAYEANIWKSYLLHFFIYFQLWWNIWVLYLTDLRGLSLAQVATMEAFFWAVAVVAEVPTGAIADRFGRRTSLALGAGFSAAGVLAFGLATNYPVIFVAYIAWALGTAFVSGAEYAMIYESQRAVGREDEFQRVSGRLGAIYWLAAVAGGIIGALIASATDLSLPVVISGAITFPGVLVALSMREPDLAEGEVRLAYGNLLRESARTAVRIPSVRTMLVLSALVTVFTFAPIIFMQPFLAGHDVDVALIGFLLAPVRLSAMAGSLVAYQATARAGTRGVFIAAPLLMAGSYILLGSLDTVFIFGAFAVVAFMNMLLLPPATEYLSRRIPQSQRATILSVRALLVSLGLAALEPGLGAAADALSLRAMFFIAAGLAGVLLPLALGLWLHADAREREGTG